MPRIAWIDLSTGATHLRPPDADRSAEASTEAQPEGRSRRSLSARFLGGRGLGAALLSRHLADPANPFAPGNPLIFAVGPLTGTPWPTGARYHVSFHSPLTGAYGYDALVITGRAERPIYLETTPEGVAIRPANHLWGLGVHATHEALATGGARVACIGLAGETGPGALGRPDRRSSHRPLHAQDQGLLRLPHPLRPRHSRRERPPRRRPGRSEHYCAVSDALGV